MKTVKPINSAPDPAVDCVAEEPARSSRLALCSVTSRTLQRGLDLLGIQVPERMYAPARCWLRR